MLKFTSNIRSLFISNLQQEENFNHNAVEEKADYLVISNFGLASASRVFNDKQLHNYIENIFKSI